MGAEPSKPHQVVRVAVPVLLHIYNVGVSQEVQALNKVLRVLGTGAFHCGVEVHGREWSYTCTLRGGTGVFFCPPRRCDGHLFCESLPMGHTVMNEVEVLRLVRLLANHWKGDSYDLLTRNCCHFSDKLCRCLGVGAIPAWITNLASTGAALVETGEILDKHRKSLVQNLAGCYSKAMMSCCSTSEPGGYSRQDTASAQPLASQAKAERPLPVQKPWQPLPASAGAQKWSAAVAQEELARGDKRGIAVAVRVPDRREGGDACGYSGRTASPTHAAECSQLMSCTKGMPSEYLSELEERDGVIADFEECPLWMEEQDQVVVGIQI